MQLMTPGTSQALISHNKLTVIQAKDLANFEDMVNKRPKLPKATMDPPNIIGQ